MKYQLYDLGVPREKVFAKAFIHASTTSLLIKGGYIELIRYLETIEQSFIGKMVRYCARTKQQLGIHIISSHNIQITRNERRYEFRDRRYGLLLKSVRRFPNKWIKELSVNIEALLAISMTFLRDKDYGLAADLIQNKIEEVKKPDYYSEDKRINSILQ